MNLAGNQLCGLDQYGRGTYNAEGITAIAGALRVTGELTECNVRGNQLDAEAAKMLAKVGTERRIMLFGIKHDQTEANFSNQGLRAVDALQIASDLRVRAALPTLSVAANQIGNQGASAIGNALKFNGALTKLE